jgi:hypothetical protein
MMKNFYRVTLISTILLALTGCSPSTDISIALTVVSDACEAANITVPVLEASGVLPSGIGNIILAYTAAISDAAASASTELVSSDPPAEQASKIIAYFAAVAVPVLGPTVGPEVQSIVNAISAAVNLFVNQFKSPAAQKAIKSGALDHQKLSWSERRVIGGLHGRFVASASKARTLIQK